MNALKKIRTKIREMIRCEPRNAAILGVLLLVAMVLIARSAAGTRQKVVAATGAAIESVISSRKDKADEKAQPAQLPGRGALREWMTRPISNPDRNLFAVRLQYFAKEGQQGIFQTETPGFWDEVEKSMSSQADQRQQRSILVENLRKEAGALKLQTTLMGEHPKAMINGQLVEPGGTVAGFSVVQIGARRVELERDGVRLEIQMNQAVR